jgi:hypothetical protein
MAQFFEVIQASNQGGREVEFFSNHPNPDNRIASVNKEVALLGGSQRGFNSDSTEFQNIKRYVRSLAAPPRNAATQNATDTGQGSSQPDQPSNRSKTFQNSVLRIDYPDNWQAYAQADAATIAPRGGLVDDGNGNQAMAYGVIINIFEPYGNQSSQQLQGRDFRKLSLEQATDQLVETLRQSNRNMRVVRDHESIRVDGNNALSTRLSNDSPLAGVVETNWLITLQRPEGLLFIVFVAPEREFQSYENAFQQMLRSIRIVN